MFSIGEFSKITGLTVKTLRFYHDEELLVPRFVDPQTGYRYYDEGQTDTARAIAYLRGLEFSLTDIKEILREQQDDEEFIQLIDRHKAVLQERIKRSKSVLRHVEQFLNEEKEAKTSKQIEYEIEEKKFPPLLAAGIRMKGRYSECGNGFR
jgi:DNA-binding transcriptional MerR regulator